MPLINFAEIWHPLDKFYPPFFYFTLKASFSPSSQSFYPLYSPFKLIYFSSSPTKSYHNFISSWVSLSMQWFHLHLIHTWWSPHVSFLAYSLCYTIKALVPLAHSLSISVDENLRRFALMSWCPTSLSYLMMFSLLIGLKLHL